MKRLILLLLAVGLATASVSQAQTFEQDYTYFSSTLLNDSTRLTGLFPVKFATSNTEWRGTGQLFVPHMFHEWFDPIYDGENQPYIDQFKGVVSYTIDSVGFFVWQQINATSLPDFPIIFEVYKTDFDFSSSIYRQSGFAAPRSLDSTEFSVSRQVGAMQVQYNVERLLQETIDPNSLRDVVNGSNVQLTVFDFTEADEPFTFQRGESVYFTVLNEFDPAHTLGSIPDGASYQLVSGFMEFANPSPSNPTAPLGDSIESYKALGLVLYRDTAVNDLVTSAFNSLTLTVNNRPRSSMWNMNARWFGVVELDTNLTSVRYHFGYDATEQGLGEVTPNPVTVDSRLPFSLIERGRVTIELYDMEGKRVAVMVDDEPYIAGKYDARIPVEKLDAGTYVARMNVSDNHYSMKFTVVK